MILAAFPRLIRVVRFLSVTDFIPCGSGGGHHVQRVCGVNCGSSAPWLSVTALTRAQTPKFVCCPYGHSGRVSSLLERPAGVRTASRLCEIFVDRLYSSWNPNHEISRVARRGGARGLQIDELVPTFQAHNRLFNNGIARGRGKRAVVCNVGGRVNCIARRTKRTIFNPIDVAQ